MLVPEIRQRVLFVFFAFAWFVFMIHVQLPNVNQEAWQRVLQSGAFYNLLGFLSGGALQKLSIIAMGITPYINASIIMQLMTVVMPQLEELAKKGGEEGRKKISQYTRWLTIVLGTIQATFMAISMERSGVFYDTSIWYLLYAIVAMVGGTLFLMWLGEQITDKGIGNGVSLIIFIGIVLRYPQYVTQTYASASQGAVSILNLVLYIAISLFIIVSIIFLYQGQRRVPVQQARRTVGRKMFAGRSTYIPLRLNNAGVISIIFAISILLLPQQALSWFGRGQVITATGFWGAFQHGLQAFSAWLNVWFTPNGMLYNVVYFFLVVVFTFFYSSIVLNTRDVADNFEENRRLRSRNPPRSADGGLSEQDSHAHHDGRGDLSRHIGRFAGRTAAGPLGDDVLSRFDVVIDRGRCGARYHHANRSAAGDARLSRVHQALVTTL